MERCLRYPTQLVDEPLRLDRFPLGAAGDRAVLALREGGLVAVAGLSTTMLPDIQAIATENDVQEFCPNDSGRFAYSNVGQWVAKGGGRGFVGIGQLEASGRLRVVGYGWSAFKENKAIIGADITTAYRVGSAGNQLAREIGPDFRMGLLLGELVIASAVHLYGANLRQISLETWASNTRARKLYDKIGFVQPLGVKPKPDYRPTLAPIGTVINGKVVRLDTDPKHQGRHIVDDERCYYRLAC